MEEQIPSKHLDQVDKPTYSIFQNYVILQNIFRHLNGSDLMNCRLVCKTWKDFSKRQFLSKVVCCVGQCENCATCEECEKKDLQAFYRTFGQDQYRFKRFEFHGLFEALEWKQFLDCRPFIQELILRDFYVDEDMEDDNGFDISETISPMNLTDLTVDNNVFGLISVQLSYLANVKNIDLCGAIIRIGGSNKKICPEKLCVKQNEEGLSLKTINGQRIENFSFSNYVDVRNLKVLHLSSMCDENVDLDLTECKKLKTLKFETNAKVTGLHKDLLLESLDIDCSTTKVDINLSEMPPSLKEFVFWNGNQEHFERIKFSSNEHKIRSLSIASDEEKLISLLNRCTNLVRLELLSRQSLNVSTLPRTLKVVKLNIIVCMRDYEFTGTLPEGLELDKLLVQFPIYHTEDIDKLGPIIGVLNPKIVILYNQYDVRTTTCDSCEGYLDPYFSLIKRYRIAFVVTGLYSKIKSRKYCNCDIEHAVADATNYHCKPASGYFAREIIITSTGISEREISSMEFYSYLRDY